MLTYAQEGRENRNKYEYLYACIKQDILAGILKEGERLPSKRAFAKNQNVSVMTVETAYAQLLAEGYISARPRSGFFVNRVSRPDIQPENPVWRPVDIKTEGEEPFADLVSNRVEAAKFPFSVWAKLMREVLSEKQALLMQPSPGQGVLQLRKAIADHLRAFRGMNVYPEQIIIGSGTEYLYGLLIQLFGYDRIYAAEDPGYPKIMKVYQAHGVRYVPVRLDDQGLCPVALEESGAQIAHLSAAHHFPTGITMPIGRRYELFSWALKRPERHLIEDEYDSEFRLSGNPIPTMASLDESGRVVYMNTFTKSLSPTIRISYMVLPPELLKQYHQKLGFYACTVSNFEQYTLARFIQEGYFEKHINRMRNDYRALRDQLIQAIQQSSLRQHTRIQEADAGLHFLLEVETQSTDGELIRSAAAQGLRLSCLSQYTVQPDTKTSHTILLNYSGLEKEKIPEVVKRLHECLKRLG